MYRSLRMLRSSRYLPLLVTGLAIVGAAFTIALLEVGISDGQFPIPGADYFYVFDPVGDAVRSGVDPYTITENARIEFFYAPPWAFAFATISWLPPLVGHLLVAGLEMFALRYIVGSWRAVGIVGLCPLLAFELALGNINLILGALIVAAVRGNTWAGLAGAAAKLSPILAIAPSRRVIRPALVAIALCIPWGPSWIAALIAQLRPADISHAIGGAQIPVPFVVRGAIAVALLLVRRPWARATAAIIAIPAFYYQTLLLLVVPLALIRDALMGRPLMAAEPISPSDAPLVGGHGSVVPRLAVILPAYNEAERIEATLRSIAGYRARLGVDWPIVVADDGSTDGTASVALAASADLGLPLEVVSYPHRGKALTVREAMIRIAGTHDVDYCMMLDADDELRIDQLDHVVWADVPTIYIGRRVAETNGAVGVRPPLLRRAMSAGMRTASRLLFGLDFPDTQCGFKLFPAAVVPDLFGQQRSAGWVFDAELLVIAHRVSRIPVLEVPVTWSPRGQSKVTAAAALWSVFSLLAVGWRYRTGRYRPIATSAPRPVVVPAASATPEPSGDE